MPESEDPRELVRRALAGEPASVQALVDRLSPVISKRVTATLWQRGRTHRNVGQDATDMIQDVFVSLFQAEGKALRAWDPARGMSLEGFVGLLAQHQVISILRSGRTSPWREEPTESEELDGFAAGTLAPDAIVSSRERLHLLLDRLRASLSPRGLELFQRMIVDEEAIDAVSVATGLTRDALYQWKSRLLRIVRTLLSEVDAPAMSEAVAPIRIAKAEAPQT